MAEELQRALDNLRFDRMVKAFCIISPDNKIYQSTLDSETEAMVNQTVSLYKGQISQLTVNTEAGLVVISKIANNWLLAVLFPPNLSLGIAVVKTKATLLALRELDLNIIPTIPVTPPVTRPTIPPPVPPPQPTQKPDVEIQVKKTPESVSAAPSVEPIPVPTATPPPEMEAMPPPIEPPPAEPSETTAPPPTLPPSPADGRVDLTFIPQGGEDLLAALDSGSPVGGALQDKFGPYARDVLFLIDGKRDVKTIAFLLGLPEYAIVEVLEFAINNRILTSPATS